MADGNDKKFGDKTTKITFELHESKTFINVMRNGEKIGQIWSQSSDGITPYPHDSTEYCLNAIQICGFDRMSETWGCASFPGKKDCVVHFMRTDTAYFKEKSKQYTEYVSRFFEQSDADMTKLKSFKDWLSSGGQLS